MIVFMIISFFRLEPQVWLLSTVLMAQEVMQVRSPRNSLNGLARRVRVAGATGLTRATESMPRRGINRAHLRMRIEPRPRKGTEDWGPDRTSPRRIRSNQSSLGDALFRQRMLLRCSRRKLALIPRIS